MCNSLAINFDHAIFHDSLEAITGDVPFQVKRRIRDAGYIEQDASDELFDLDESDLLMEISSWKAFAEGEFENGMLEKRIVKAADHLDVLMYCLSEQQLGNKGFSKIKEEIIWLLRSSGLFSIDYILDQVHAGRGIKPHDRISHL